jgi:hypothetical protein
MAIFFGTMLGAYTAFPLPEAFRARALALGGTVALAITALVSVSFPGYPMSDPIENLENAGATLAAFADGGELDSEIAENRARLREQFALDERSLSLLDGHTVHVDPSETAVAWAYGLDWSPLPIFQPYGAWTAELDRRNAEALASADGPDRVVRQRIEVIGRYPGFESPAAMVAMLCNFEELSTTEAWQVLGRVPDRCGEPRSIGTAEGTYGAPIEVPPAPPRSAVIARVDGVQVSGLERLRTMAARSRARTIRFGDDPRRWTLVERTAKDGLLLAVPPQLDFPAPFALAPNPETITFLLDGGSSDQEIDVEFFALPLSGRR